MEAIAANFAVILSVCAIVMSYVEINTLQDQKHAEVWPRVYTSVTTSSSDKIFSINLHNKGVGPAIIKYVELTVDDKNHLNWKSAVEATIAEELESFGYSGSSLTNATITPGEVVSMMKIEGDLALKVIPERRFMFNVCYCSIFDRCWIVNNSHTLGFPEPEPIDECVVDKIKQFRR